MKAPKFEKLFAQLVLLNQPQRQQALAALHPAAGLDRVVALIGEIRSKRRCCPDCGCERCHRHGQANDLQRFRCCACGRTFNDLTGTPLARVRHKGKWLGYLETVLDSQALLVTDANAAYRAFARAHGIAHQSIRVPANGSATAPRPSSMCKT